MQRYSESFWRDFEARRRLAEMIHADHELRRRARHKRRRGRGLSDAALDRVIGCLLMALACALIFGAAWFGVPHR